MLGTRDRRTKAEYKGITDSICCRLFRKCELSVKRSEDDMTQKFIVTLSGGEDHPDGMMSAAGMEEVISQGIYDILDETPQFVNCVEVKEVD
jgi:hypothetical protein